MRLSFFDRFSSSELLNTRLLDKGKIRQNFGTSFFFWLFSSEPTNISRRENIPQKSKRRVSPDNFLLTYLNQWIRQEITFPDKCLSAFLLPVVSFFLYILNCRTANFSTSENSDKSLNIVFLPTMHFLLNRWTFSGRDQLPTKVCTVFINLQSLWF